MQNKNQTPAEGSGRSRVLRDSVLILDEDREFRSQMKKAVQASIKDIEVFELEPGEDAWTRIASGGITVAVIPYNSSELSGDDILHRINLHRLSTRVVMTSRRVRAQEVVKAIKNGALDFLERPFEPDQLIESVRSIINRVRTDRIEIQEGEAFEVNELIGDAPSIRSIRELIKQVAPTKSTVLITGESGTGKEVAARDIHRISKRADKKLVVVDCGTIPAGLVESELFGYKAGAFTGASGDKAGLLEQANESTAFLDEVGEFPLDLQVKLLRVLQDGEIRRLGSDKAVKLDLRIIAATNKNLAEEVKAGRFRQDLFYRLNVVNIEMPALRERVEDIETFVNYFLQKHQKEYDHTIKGITKGAMTMLKNYEWPGNVRELEHTMLQIMALHNRKPVIEERDLPMFLERRGRERQRRFLQDALDLKLSLDDYAKEFVRMFEGQYSEKEIASTLGMTTKTLWQKRKKWGMPRKGRS